MAGKFDYARLARTAQRLIDRFGKVEKITGYVDVPNVDQPNRPGTRTLIDQDTNCVFLDIDAKHVDGTLIRSGDMKVLASPMGMTLDPQMTGTITRGDEIWSIVSIKELNPGGMKLLYTIQVRK